MPSPLSPFGFDGNNNPGHVDDLGEIEETIVPMHDRLLLKVEETHTETSGGIVLPDSAQVPSCRAIVLEVSWFIQRSYDANEVPVEARIRVFDKVIFTYAGAMVDNSEAIIKPNHRLLVPFRNIIGVVKPDTQRSRS
jgi:co-chaperonin GroES (HSP10)